MTDARKLAIRPSFISELRRSLRHLYDPVALRKSPFVTSFGVEQQKDAPSALRGILSEAIESIKPGSDVPSGARAWRIYQLLYARYIEQFSQREVASALGLSIRHLRREEAAALETLAAYLWHQRRLGAHWQDQCETQDDAGTETALVGSQTPTQEQELQWLQESGTSQSIDAQDLIQGVLELVRPLAQTSQVQIEWRVPNSSPSVIVQLTAIRQALLAIFTVLIQLASKLAIELKSKEDRVSIRIEARGSRSVSAPSQDQAEQLAMAQQLIELSNGYLEITSGRQYHIDIVLPAVEQRPVLIIDDNKDTLRLLERYLSNTRYLFIGALAPRQAVQLAIEQRPQIIVLDVMLPEIDGWQLLGRLREHPQTQNIPIIVCTILPYEQLAMKLGAADFVRKPVTRQTLLAALDRQFALLPKESL